MLVAFFSKLKMNNQKKFFSNFLIIVLFIVTALSLMPDCIYKQCIILNRLYVIATEGYSRGDLRLGISSIMVSTLVAILLYKNQNDQYLREQKEINQKTKHQFGIILYNDIYRYLVNYCNGGPGYSKKIGKSSYDYFELNKKALISSLGKDFPKVEELMENKLDYKNPVKYEENIFSDWIKPVLKYGCFNHLLPRANLIYCYLSKEVNDVFVLLGILKCKDPDSNDLIIADKAGNQLISKSSDGIYLIYDGADVAANCSFEFVENEHVTVSGYVRTEEYIGHVLKGKKNGEGSCLLNGKVISSGKFSDDKLIAGIKYNCLMKKSGKFLVELEKSYEELFKQPFRDMEKIFCEDFNNDYIADIVVKEGKLEKILRIEDLYGYMLKNDKEFLEYITTINTVRNELKSNSLYTLKRQLKNEIKNVNWHNGNGWDNSSGEWVYLRNGQVVVNKWVSANGNWFYLGDDGRMVINTIIEDESNQRINIYYVDEYGAMVTDKRINYSDENGNVCYYFGSDGKGKIEKR